MIAGVFVSTLRHTCLRSWGGVVVTMDIHMRADNKWHRCASISQFTTAKPFTIESARGWGHH